MKEKKLQEPTGNGAAKPSVVNFGTNGGVTLSRLKAFETRLDALENAGDMDPEAAKLLKDLPKQIDSMKAENKRLAKLVESQAEQLKALTEAIEA